MFQVKEDVNDETVIIVAEGDSPDFENVDDEVDVEATPVVETDRNEHTLPGQACYSKSVYYKSL